MNLTEYVKRVSWEDFGLSFKHKAVWNKRLKSSGGRFFPKDGHLDFNPHLYEAYGLDVFRKIVRHELCHYHLYFAQKGYRHQDKDFKELLATVGGLRYAPKMAKTQACYTYICSSCHLEFQRQRRVNLQKFVCGSCHGKLIEKNQS